MFRITLSFVVLLLASTSTFAQSVPPLMNYQGHLTDAAGQPLATGQYTLTFNVYNVPTGGTAVWGPQAIVADVIDGYFNVVLNPRKAVSRVGWNPHSFTVRIPPVRG